MKGDHVTRQEIQPLIDSNANLASSVGDLVKVCNKLEIQNAKNMTLIEQTIKRQDQVIENQNARMDSQAKDIDDLKNDEKVNRDWRVKSTTMWGFLTVVGTTVMGVVVKKLFFNAYLFPQFQAV